MRGGAMAARITDRKKKRIIADWIEMQSYSAVAKKHGVTHQTVKRIVSASPDIAQKVQEKKEENTADMMAYMESQKKAMQEAITLHHFFSLLHSLSLCNNFVLFVMFRNFCQSYTFGIVLQV